MARTSLSRVFFLPFADSIASLGCALMLGALMLGPGRAAQGQTTPTATQALHLSVFGGATGRQTSFGSGRNGDITVGFDFGLRPYRFIRPSLELRGTIAVDKGHVDSQKDGMGGVKLETKYRLFHPYVDALFGRAGIVYAAPGAPLPGTPIIYTSSSTLAMAGGGGVDYDLTRHFAFKADSQLYRLSTPVTPGHIHPYEVTLGVVYRIGGGWRKEKIARTKHH